MTTCWDIWMSRQVACWWRLWHVYAGGMDIMPGSVRGSSMWRRTVLPAVCALSPRLMHLALTHAYNALSCVREKQPAGVLKGA